MRAAAAPAGRVGPLATPPRCSRRGWRSGCARARSCRSSAPPSRRSLTGHPRYAHPARSAPSRKQTTPRVRGTAGPQAPPQMLAATGQAPHPSRACGCDARQPSDHPPAPPRPAWHASPPGECQGTPARAAPAAVSPVGARMPTRASGRTLPVSSMRNSSSSASRLRTRCHAAQARCARAHRRCVRAHLPSSSLPRTAAHSATTSAMQGRKRACSSRLATSPECASP